MIDLLVHDFTRDWRICSTRKLEHLYFCEEGYARCSVFFEKKGFLKLESLLLYLGTSFNHHCSAVVTLGSCSINRPSNFLFYTDFARVFFLAACSLFKCVRWFVCVSFTTI